MSVCFECGSPTTENDQFCPFCGISLRPLDVASDGTVADEHTIAIPLDEVPEAVLKLRQEAAAAREAESSAIREADLDAASTELVEAEDEVEASKESEELTASEPAEGTYQAQETASPTDPGSEMIEASQDDPAEHQVPELDLMAAEGPEDIPIASSEAAVQPPAIPLDSDFDLGRVPIPSATTIDPGPAEASVSEDQGSFTTPNIGGSGGSKRTGLKPLEEGTILNDRYLIEKKIGGGGMGAVYLAKDRNLGDVPRAVKEMVQSHIEEAQQEKAIEDFRRESMILSSLDHPAIPTIYDYFFDQAEGRFYLVMKYIPGGDLAQRLRSAPERRIDEATVVQWGIEVADVLDYLHNLPQRIVYRDLKPSNVMLDSAGKVMLVDFGIARSIHQQDQKGVTAIGTMGYAPPELFGGKVDPRSDIYSLGSTMFHLLTGADPQNNPLLIFDFEKNPRPRQINPRLSDQIESIIMRAVEYNAEHRWSSAGELRHELTRHLSDLRSGNVTYGVGVVPTVVSLSHQFVFCGFCGQKIVAADQFCAFCGAKQPIAQQQRPLASPVTTARLVIDGTSELIAPAFTLEKEENLVGRRDPTSNIFPEVDLSKFDPQTKISRRHARILRDGSMYYVEDLGSSNGTVIIPQATEAMRLLPHRPHPLATGDRIRLGDTTLHFLAS
ncbi:MAG: protein kinase [Acidobacteria bacterium]|nr:protein kinase [Acidobacteriota bacterium]MCW5950560.1 protein kinase [Pyrinomonadaceae bacterium]